MLRRQYILAGFFISISGLTLISFIPDAFGQTDTITVKHWFISSYENECSYGNEKSLDYYEYLTSQYLKKYDINVKLTDGKCVLASDVLNNLETFEEVILEYDLPIIVLDAFSGIEYVLTTDAFGHYRWGGNEHVIIFVSLSPFIESDVGAWILGHELSHFVLNHKNYPLSIFGTWVHIVESNARSCIGDNLSLNECPELWTTVKAPSGKSIKIMKIYDGQEITPTTSSNSRGIAIAM